MSDPIAPPTQLIEKKDLLEHARLVHTSCLAVTLTLLVVLAGSGPKQLSSMAEEARRLSEIVAEIPHPQVLFDLARPDWFSCVADPRTYQPLACIPPSDLAALPMPNGHPLVSILRDRLKPDENFLHRPVFSIPESNLAFSISDAEALWLEMGKQVSPSFWVVADFIVIDCPTSREQECSTRSLVSTTRLDKIAPQLSDARLVEPEGISTALKKLLPPKRRGIPYEGWLEATDSATSSRLIVPLYRYKSPPTIPGNLFLDSRGQSGRSAVVKSWSPFSVEFPTLASSDPTLKAISLISAESVLSALGKQFSDRQLKLLGLELRVKNVALVGLWVLFVLIAYLWLHLVELARRPGSDAAIAWVAVYDTVPAKAVTVASLIAPSVAALYIAGKSAAESGWYVWIPSLGILLLTVGSIRSWYSGVAARCG